MIYICISLGSCFSMVIISHNTCKKYPTYYYHAKTWPQTDAYIHQYTGSR